MCVKLNVGLSKKIGLPEYGSVGASCYVEIELPGSLVLDDLEGFHKHVRSAYIACRQAIQDELAQHQPSTSASSAGQTGNGSAASASPTESNGNGHDSHGSNGNGARQATEKQVTYIRQLAGQVKGLGVRRLETLSQRMFGKPVAGLTSLDASGLIDTCKAIKAGEIDLDAALNGAST